MIKSVSQDNPKKIVISNEKGESHSHVFAEDIFKYLNFDNKVIVALNYMDHSKTLGNRNVFCLNDKAQVLWQIQDPDERAGDGKQSRAPFSGILVTEKGGLRATNWDSNYYEVDIETGKLLDSHWTK